MKRLGLPSILSALDRKLLRDLWHMKGQAIAIAFVIAAGVSVHLLAEGMLSSYKYSGFWQCMDTFKDLLRLENMERAGAPWKLWQEGGRHSLCAP